MLKIDCDIKEFMAENIPLGDDKPEDNELIPPNEPEEQKGEELVIHE